MPLDLNIFGEGIYTPRQAARLVGSTPQEVLRWTRGSGPSEPLWSAHYQALDDTTELSFLDLIEVRVVKAFRLAGLSFQSIRYAIEKSKDLYDVAYPLTTLRFKTDGKEILIEALEKDGSHISLSKKSAGQKVFTEIVHQSLRDLEYDSSNAIRWKPHFSKGVVIDPERQFGAPILDAYGISTSTIYDEFKNFSDLIYLSKIYEVPRRELSKAVRYEEYLDHRIVSADGKGTI